MTPLIQYLKECNARELERMEEELAQAKAAQKRLSEIKTDAELPFEITIRKSICGPFTKPMHYPGPLEAALQAAREQYLKDEGESPDEERIVVSVRFPGGHWILLPGSFREELAAA